MVPAFHELITTMLQTEAEILHNGFFFSACQPASVKKNWSWLPRTGFALSTCTEMAKKKIQTDRAGGLGFRFRDVS